MTILTGPIAQRAKDRFRESVHGKEGGHYNTFSANDDNAMEFLRLWFPDAVANEMNFVLFSTSGIHGSYATIEEVEDSLRKYPGLNPNKDGYPEDDPEYCHPQVTFVVVQPRLVTMTCGNVQVTLDDIPFLKKLRQSSWEAVQSIGKHVDTQANK